MKVIMQWTYHASKKPSAVFVSDWLEAETALVITEDLEKAGRLKEVEFKDEFDTIWTKKELKKLLKEVEEEPQDVTVYFDGGYQKEKGMAGIGVAIYYRQGKKFWRLRTNLKLEQFDSNNEAEYAAFHEAVKQIEDLGVHHQSCVFKGDSLVVLNQLSGEWPCMEENLNKWLDRIEAKLDKLKIIPDYQPITRKENQEADRLATLALEGKAIFSKFEIAGSKEPFQQ
ncbi:reverse transcriptase-like protein [Peribacillus muralis]|uniref:reverse transcriptase-like protein n=1 Tax=Peribacillus muralis TaxID=264697 RepID=UPI001F4DC31C|nr:reverse transcriptase-like protein [Peribacillus muralis]MCK1991246.1 reverse transcriptase-like protein [Peribacillus muralis]MCK2011800.1 reverse transcriptase-like protein [Peribacillus muralis]